MLDDCMKCQGLVLVLAYPSSDITHSLELTSQVPSTCSTHNSTHHTPTANTAGGGSKRKPITVKLARTAYSPASQAVALNRTG
jgi:hypothetical protein